MVRDTFDIVEKHAGNAPLSFAVCTQRAAACVRGAVASDASTYNRRMQRAPDGAALAVVRHVNDRRCVRCGDQLTSPWWVTAYPDGAHESCIDWSLRPFPFTRELEVLRKLTRHTRNDDARALREAERELNELRRRWPMEAHEVLAAGRSIIAVARAHLGALDHRLRQQL